MEDVTDDKWMCPAKATQAVNQGNDGPDWGYYGGCGIDVIDYGYDSDRLELRYRWDTECDGTFDGVVMNVGLITVDNVNMQCGANITSKADSDHCALWLDNETVIDPVSVGASFERTHAYGWFTTRFVVRHGTKIAANMYNALGETDKATKLLNLWYGSGYTKDAYDGVWGASNSYPDYVWDIERLIWVEWLGEKYEVMPDWYMWGNIPWFQMGQEGTEHSGVPYRSQLNNVLVVELGFETGPPLTPGVSWWMSGFTAKMAWACHLLNKYNTSDASKLAEAKQLIDDVSWDGLGVNCETLRVGPTLLSLYQYACYVPYAEAEYLAALTKYWGLTGDEVYGQRADEVAGILLKVQVKPGDKIRVVDSNGDIRLIWRPDNTGGFMCGYKYGGGWDFGSSPWWLADKYFWCTSALGRYNRDYGELSSCGWTNHETTLMSYAALYQYNKTGRTPLTSSVDFTMPFFDAQASTSHSDHGCDSIQADKSGNIRTFLSMSAYGESWATVTYSWTVELPALTNFKTKLTVYIPYYGQDGNAVERWVRIYRHNGTLLVSDYDKPINGVGGYGERYIIYTNMTPIDSLIAGIYTIKLTFRFSCGWAGEFAVGYRYDYLMRPTEPMHIESFGYDADVVPTPLNPKYHVHLDSSGPGAATYRATDQVQNGRFETGNLANWNNFYAPCTITTGAKHTGSYGAHCSDSILTQTLVQYPTSWLEWNAECYVKPSQLYSDIGSGEIRFGVEVWKYDTLPLVNGTNGPWEYVEMGWIRVLNIDENHEEFFVTYRSSYANSFLLIWSNNFTGAYVGNWQHWKITLKNDLISWYWNETLLASTTTFFNGSGSGYSGPMWSGGLQADFGAVGSTSLFGEGYRGAIADFDDVSSAVVMLPNLVIDATPDPGKYFWYWIINNTALGIYWNFTANPFFLYVDHDYNVTAYFGDTYEPPPPNRTLVISNHDPALGTTSPSPGNYSYVQGSLVSVNATPNTGYIFEYWRCIDGGIYNNYSNPITVEMDQDYYRLVAFFGGTTIYFPVYDSSSVELLSEVQICYGYPNHWWMPLSPLYIDAPLYVHANDCPIGTFSFKFSAIGYYDYYVWNITIPTGSTFYFPTVWMNGIGFYVPKGGGGLCYLRSSLITFYATMPYSNETQYADMDHYIRVEVLPGTSGTLKLVIHYDSDYPIVEIETENLTLTEFDLEAVYQHYCLSSYKDMQQASLFTGLKISSNTPLKINLEMPQALDFWHRPSELLKIGEDGGISSFSSWQCTGRTVTLNFEPGDPTVSMLFHAMPDAMTLTMWGLIPFVFVVGSIVMAIEMTISAKNKNFKEFAILLVGFLIVTALIPIVPQIMA
jgi:hypothetical protein